jgi:dCTP deaminase
MLLNDKQIKELLNNGLFAPFVLYKERGKFSFGIEPFGYTLRMGYHWAKPVFELSKDGIFDSRENKVVAEKFMGDSFVVDAKSSCVNVLMEHIKVPDDCQMRFEPKSSWLRNGIIPMPAPAEGGWEGDYTLAIYNSNDFPVRLYAGDGIIQAFIERGDSAENGYTGNYQGAIGVRLN